MPVFAAVVAFCVACGGADVSETAGRPLLDDGHMPDVLTESRRLKLPPATGGNRFLAGWWPWSDRGRQALVSMDGGGRIELVHLSRRPRVLVLDLLDSEVRDGHVRVRAAGQDLGRQPIADPLRIDLPADLPLGRATVEVIPEDGQWITVRAAALRTAVPAGAARRDGSDISQTGTSFIDMVRRVEAGALLTGVFQPPASPRDGQEFLLHVERLGESRTVFRWQATTWERWRGRRSLDIPLGTEAGFVRIRLEARGEGPAARWNALALRAAAGDVPAGFERPEPTAAGRPPALVIVYVMDALRADRVGHLDHPAAATPVLDALAREGLTFLDHRSVAPNTLPSTKALLTGSALVENGGGKLPSDGLETLAEIFRDAGYATALFSNNPYVSAAYGVERGFDQVAAPGAGDAPFHDDAARIHAAALDWLGSLAPGQPAFLYLHTLHPHNPYDPPPALRERYTAGMASSIDGSTRTLIDIQRQRRETDAADRERLAGLYVASLAYNDAELGHLMAEVEALYDREEIFLAVSSDHGEELFDHGGVLHGYTLYEEMIRIPLVLWSPGRVGVGRRRTPTSTLDLHATLCELAGAGEAVSEGHSLFAAAGDGVHMAAAASVKGGVFSAQSRRLKLIWAPRTGRGWGMGEALGRSRDAEYLFDLEADPEENVNRAGFGGLEVAWLRSQLLAWVASKRAAPAAEPEIDEETRGRLEALGYLD